MTFAFVSDFDNTITLKDFYTLIIEKYSPPGAADIYERFHRGEVSVLDLLGFVFNNIHKDRFTIMQDILSLPLDSYAADFIRWFVNEVGPFYIVSAGCSYYIEILLEKYGLLGLVTLVANPGYYHDGNIYILPNPNDDIYSPSTGVDKGKVVEGINRQADFTFFAGDSEPDYPAAIAADFAFARENNSLAELMRRNGKKFSPYSSFRSIYEKTREVLFEHSGAHSKVKLSTRYI
ncbi:MAG: hypothetical protein A2Y33_07760 [Spirochaetes bacterium GWF1_51_8]|nr:MAG: hypothetical protein A2Y33_07760 [Spirochaetes bacterium GWF1_51_8]